MPIIYSWNNIVRCISFAVLPVIPVVQSCRDLDELNKPSGDYEIGLSGSDKKVRAVVLHFSYCESRGLELKTLYS